MKKERSKKGLPAHRGGRKDCRHTTRPRGPLRAPLPPRKLALIDEQSYYLWVTAMDGAKESHYGSRVSAVPEANPPPPALLPKRATSR